MKRCLDQERPDGEELGELTMYLKRFRLDGRVAVVTGGAQAIGFACVEALSEAGAHVYIADRNPEAGAEAQEKLAAKGIGVDFIEMDVTNSAAVDAAAARVLKEKGRVDILVCNAGIARSETAAEDLTDEHRLNVIDVNLNGLFWCCRAFGRPMLAAGRGSIVNTGSMSGYTVTSLNPRRNTMRRRPVFIISRSRSPRNRRRAACGSTRSRRPTSTRR
jgi:NAD(P)-dependent dehydrogenase (short-subunit alcohol dehydrogenase family)